MGKGLNGAWLALGVAGAVAAAGAVAVGGQGSRARIPSEGEIIKALKALGAVSVRREGGGWLEGDPRIIATFKTRSEMLNVADTEPSKLGLRYNIGDRYDEDEATTLTIWLRGGSRAKKRRGGRKEGVGRPRS